MKNIYLIIGLLIVFFAGTGVKTVEAQDCWIELGVTLEGTCVKVNHNTKYYINLTIIDVCDNNTVVHTANQVVLTTGTPEPFCVEDVLCKIDDQEVCYKVVFTVQKRHTITQAVVCSGQTILSTVNCAGLMALDGGSTPVFLDL